MLFPFWAFLLLSLFTGGVSAQGLGSAEDWSQVGHAAGARGLPVVVLVTGTGCSHCDRLHRDLFADPESCTLLQGMAVAREIDLDAGGKITDFDGERVRSRIFLSRYGVFAVPTLLFLDAEGKPLIEPLVGYNTPETYRQLLSERLARVREKLASRALRSAANQTAASASLGH